MTASSPLIPPITDEDCTTFSISHLGIPWDLQWDRHTWRLPNRARTPRQQAPLPDSAQWFPL